MSRYNVIVCYEKEEDFFYDSNAAIGYDENNESWFIQAFEYQDEDGNDVIKLWLGNEFQEFMSLESLLTSLGKNFTIITESHKDLYDYFPTSESILSKLFIKSLDIWARLDREYTENSSKHDNEIDFDDFCAPYKNELDDAEMFIQDFGENVEPKNIEILREIFDSYSQLFSENNIECSCVRAKMSSGWDGIHGWLK